MTALSTAGRNLDAIIEKSGNDFAGMTNEEIAEFIHVTNAATVGASTYLIELCGGDLTRAEAFIRRARDLPKYRLQRKVKKFEDAMFMGREPNRPQIAVHIARLLLTAETLTAQLERRITQPAVN